MSKNFSIDKAAKDTAVNTKPGILARLFRNRLHAQFEKIKADLSNEISKGLADVDREAD